MNIMEGKSSVKFISLVFLLISSILSISNWHIAAQFGIHSVYYLIFVSLFFLLPVALVSCELASSYSSYGGVYAWIKDAFGLKVGLLCSWLMWVSNIVWYPTVFSFIATSLVYHLRWNIAENRILILICMNLLFWLSNLANILGYKFSSRWISVSVICSMLVPGCLLIFFGILHFPANTDQWTGFFSGLCHFEWNMQSSLTLLTGLLLGFTGSEIAMVHYDKHIQPEKFFPKAIWYSTLLLMIVSIFGTIGILQVVPKENVNLITDSLDAIYYHLKMVKMDHFMPLINILIAFGSWFAMSAYLSEPSKAFLQAVKNSGLSRGLAKSSNASIPTKIMFLQGIFVSLISLPAAFFPDLTDFYWLLTDFASQLYLLLYLVMFSAVIYLKAIKKVYPIKIIPFGTKGVWFFSCIGIVVCIVCFCTGCLPPPHSSITYPILYSSFVVLAISVMAVVPLLILKYKRIKKNYIDKEPNEV